MMYHGVMIWSLLVFPCLPFVSFFCFNAFPVTVSVGFLSAFVSFYRSRFSFSYLFLLLHSHFCQTSAFPIFSSCDFFPPANYILYHPFCIFFRRFRFSIWFCVLERNHNEDKNEGKIHDKLLGMDLARNWQTFFPIPATTRTPPTATVGPNYAFAAGFFILLLPAKHQRHHHYDDYW